MLLFARNILTFDWVLYFQREAVLEFPGGIPTSKIEKTSQQWDYPNVWSPLVALVIDALEGLSSTEGHQMAANIAQTLVASNHDAWLKYGAMYEKVRLVYLL